MGRKLIVGYDGTAPARDALALARRLVFATGADMILANVYPGRLYADVGKGDDQSYFNIMKRNAERVLAEAPTGVHAELRAVAASSPAHGLHDLAKETDAEFVVLGSTHRSKLGLIEPGSTGERLLHGAPCAVAVAPIGYAEHSTDRPGCVVVGCNGTPESQVALEAGIEFARRLDASLRVVAAIEPAGQIPHLKPGHEVTFVAWLREQRQRELTEAIAQVPDDVEAVATIVEKTPADALRELEGADLLVLGTSGWGRVRGAVLGSVSAKVVRGANAPVLIVPSHRASDELNPGSLPTAALA